MSVHRWENGRPLTLTEGTMNTSKRITICTLILVLLVAVAPVAGRFAVVPCHYMWRYAISYAPSSGNILVPENYFSGFPPRCEDVIANYLGIL
jgi:hypothetical protein